MMRLLNNKKNVKTVSIIVGILFVISVGALAYTQMAGYGGSNAVSNIGVIDMQRIVESNPNLVQDAQQEYATYNEELQKEFNEKSANLDEAGKAKLSDELRQKMQEKQQTIQDNLKKRVDEASKAVADAKGLSVVLSRESVLFGGTDITEQVSKKLTETK
ncbi:OmpH family outer membrane protein [Veillonella sp. VA142]|uniref:OmpH family outer membrane protein n=1 Tax=Veillonella sp. VA142 TaxID=741834 RepID=UPI000F8C64CF|nr:OmpH family outer membrane protein [Veillonella sp. VA142]